MKTRLQKLRCRLTCHWWDEDELTYLGIAHCTRCGHHQVVGPAEPWTLLEWWRGVKWRVWGWWHFRSRIRAFFSRMKWRIERWLGRDDIPF